MVVAVVILLLQGSITLSLLITTSIVMVVLQARVPVVRSILPSGSLFTPSSFSDSPPPPPPPLLFHCFFSLAYFISRFHYRLGHALIEFCILFFILRFLTGLCQMGVIPTGLLPKGGCGKNSGYGFLYSQRSRRVVKPDQSQDGHSRGYSHI